MPAAVACNTPAAAEAIAAIASRLSPAPSVRSIPGNSTVALLPQCVEHRAGQLLTTDEEVGEPLAALVVDERRAVDPTDMQTGGDRHGRRCGRVPLVHAAVVEIDVGLAEYDRHRLGARRTEPHGFGVERVGDDHSRV